MQHTLAYGLVMELLDAAGHLLDWRTYQVAVIGGQFPYLLPAHHRVGPCTLMTPLA